MAKTKEREAEKPAAKTATRSAVKISVPKAAAAKPPTDKVKVNGSAAKHAAAAKAPAASKSSAKIAVTKTPVSKTAAEKSERSSERIERQEREREKGREREKAAEKLLSLKSPFPRDELARWRQQLLEKRNEISSDIAGLEKDAMEAEDGHTTPNHIAERGSDADLQDVSLGIAGEEKDIIWQIDRALRKIENAQPVPFGLCEYTKEPIPRNRLQLIPWTPLSIEGANHMESNGLQVEDMLVDG